MREVGRIDVSVLKYYPKPDFAAVERMLQEEINKNHSKIVVLDDDPTGVQTVHDVSVYTRWDKASMRSGFSEQNKLFYVLTNSRGLTAGQTEKLHKEIAETIAETAKEQKKDFLIISRSDSTLRGHYPLEPRVLREVIEQKTGIPLDGEILCPFFREGGRFTIDNVHYVKYGNDLVPAGKTEFAGDKTFGYSSSDLRDYIEEKTQGSYRKEDVTSISLEDLRAMNLDKIERQLEAVRDFNKIVVNAIDYVDIKLFCIALYRAMSHGKHYLFRSAAALVKVMGGISDQPLLSRNQMIKNNTNHGGLVIIGSHTAKTTAQLEELKNLEGIVCVEFNSDLVLKEEAFRVETEAVTRRMEAIITEGKTAVVYTKRKLLTVENDTKEEALKRSVKISDAVQSLVGNLMVTPDFIIAKGGITSSDIGTKALAVRRANVMGQIKPGIPVWQTGPESKFPCMPYVIFPGNVGEAETLRETVEILVGLPSNDTKILHKH